MIRPALIVAFALLISLQNPKISSSQESSTKVCVGDCMVVWEEIPSSSELKDIYFRTNGYVPDDTARSILRKNADYLKNHPIIRIEIQGHCDERGGENYNIALGERREQIIKMYLVSQGISGSRIFTMSYGEEKPVCHESTEECWLENRRGHFMVGK